MNAEELLSGPFQKYMKKGSVGMLLIVVALLWFDSLQVMDITKIPIPGIKSISWGYLLLNVGVATPLYYWREKNTKKPACPQCNNDLEVIPKYEYNCENCGKIKFENKKKKKK